MICIICTYLCKCNIYKSDWRSSNVTISQPDKLVFCIRHLVKPSYLNPLNHSFQPSTLPAYFPPCPFKGFCFVSQDLANEWTHCQVDELSEQIVVFSASPIAIQWDVSWLPLMGHACSGRWKTKDLKNPRRSCLTNSLPGASGCRGVHPFLFHG